MPHPSELRIFGARAHNLRDLDVAIPHDAVTVITGVSGSGKSSLAVDCLLMESRRRYLGAVAGPALHRLGKLGKAEIRGASGLRAGVLLGQAGPGGGPRSTVGTVSGLLDPLRLLLARVGERRCGHCAQRIDRATRCGACGAQAPALLASLLSFNGAGACPRCQGLGLVDRVDPALLVADPARSLREGALVPTTPKPYIVYSQVTMEVLDTVCRAHGFTVDTPWERLSDEQREVVFRGSERVVVPFGKHPLESRLRWSGITARPREEGHYRGIVTTIEGILATKRNPGVLRFVRSMPCPDCGGTRLSDEARAVRLGGRDLAAWTALPLAGLARELGSLPLGPREEVAAPLVELLRQRSAELVELGLGHITLGRATDSLSGGEARRVQLASCLAGGLGRLLYVLDEPSAGLHPRELDRLWAVLERLRGLGNTVVLVEHDPRLVEAAEHLVVVGPAAGSEGGRLLYQGPAEGWRAAEPAPPPMSRGRRPSGWLRLRGATGHNLKQVDVSIPRGCLVGVAGVSGAGKTSLALGTLARALQARRGQSAPPPLPFGALDGAEAFAGVEVVDAAPIGRSPRSNAATYTKLFDAVRKLWAQQPLARERGWSASRFSFNTAGGRCERCEGAGSLAVGMHFLPDAHIPCPACGGARFDDATLEVRFRGHDIHELLELRAAEALALLGDQPAVARVLEALVAVGLGYLPLGQPATTISGGEARRIKLAAHLARPPRGATLYVLDEPSVGLHPRDVAVLVEALQGLVDGGHTVLVVDHDRGLLGACDHLLELGPGGGEEGGRVVSEGRPEAVLSSDASRGRDAAGAREVLPCVGSSTLGAPEAIRLRGVSTHNLREVDVDIPGGALTVITGVSGSGKSSLAFDTLHAEAWRRFGSSLPGEARRRLARLPRPALGSAQGLGPSVAVGQRAPGANPRSVVGSAAGLLPLLRLLWARFGERRCPACGGRVEDDTCVACGAGAPVLSAGHFSFNDERGACPTCDGLGERMACDPDRLVSHPERSLWHGAMDGSKLGRHLGEPDGRYLATLATAAEALGLDPRGAWRDLGPDERRLALEGTGDRVWRVRWRYKRGKRAGEHLLEEPWPGLLALVDAAWERDHAGRKGRELEPLMDARPCGACGGERLAPWPRGVRFGGLRLGELCALDLDAVKELLEAWDRCPGEHGISPAAAGASVALRAMLTERVDALRRLGLGYLSPSRGSDSLSGGEARRVQLAGLLASELAGLCCVLDEPTMGLHPRDSAALVGELRRLVERGDTVVVVEHDLDVVRAADHLIELGPGAGSAGGRVVAQGSPRDIEASAGSLTGAWLRGEATLPRRGRAGPAGPPLLLRAVHRHNLRELDVSIPTGGLIGVAGVSGSGKSTLLLEVLEPSLSGGRPVGCAAVEGGEGFARVVRVDARAFAGSALSTPATLAGLLPLLAARYAASPEARAAGLKAASFQYTSPRGRCPTCKGTGEERVGLELLATVRLPCEACGGSRVSPAVAALRVDGLSVAEALDLTVAEAAPRFETPRGLAEGLRGLARLGLGYLRLGQPANSLSGGERRRLKLAAALLDGGKGRGLFLLDEPCVGLHPQDVSALLQVLDGLVLAGHTVIAVEHDLGLLSRCDHILELGPEGGPGGGRVVAQGRPEEIAAAGTATGRALAALL